MKERETYFDHVVIAAATRYVTELPLLVADADTIIEYMVNYPPFREAIKAGFELGFAKGFDTKEYPDG